MNGPTLAEEVRDEIGRFRDAERQRGRAEAEYDLLDSYVKLRRSNVELLAALRLMVEALNDLGRQLPRDERLADYDLSLAERADLTAHDAIAKAEGGSK